VVLNFKTTVTSPTMTWYFRAPLPVSCTTLSCIDVWQFLTLMTRQNCLPPGFGQVVCRMVVRLSTRTRHIFLLQNAHTSSSNEYQASFPGYEVDGAWNWPRTHLVQIKLLLLLLLDKVLVSLGLPSDYFRVVTVVAPSPLKTHTQTHTTYKLLNLLNRLYWLRIIAATCTCTPFHKPWCSAQR